MSKRSSQLDKYPNYMTGQVTQSAADTATVSQFTTPIPRLQTKGGKATVMELLSIEYNNNNTALDAINESIGFVFFGGQTSVTFTDLLISNPRVIANVDQFVTGATNVGINIYKQYGTIKLQSKDGYGFLYAGDAINLLVTSTNTGVANRVDFRIYYRFVEIPIVEFVGLVQSQQQSTS